jgi:hypothetical protein
MRPLANTHTHTHTHTQTHTYKYHSSLQYTGIDPSDYNNRRDRIMYSIYVYLYVRARVYIDTRYVYMYSCTCTRKQFMERNWKKIARILYFYIDNDDISFKVFIIHFTIYGLYGCISLFYLYHFRLHLETFIFPH